MQFDNSLSLAQKLDANDPLKEFRKQFIIPQRNGIDNIYFLGNSLGLQPKSANEYIQKILADWSENGVEAFFESKEPWMDYHDQLVTPLATISLGNAPTIVAKGVTN